MVRGRKTFCRESRQIENECETWKKKMLFHTGINVVLHFDMQLTSPLENLRRNIHRHLRTAIHHILPGWDKVMNISVQSVIQIAIGCVDADRIFIEFHPLLLQFK